MPKIMLKLGIPLLLSKEQELVILVAYLWAQDFPVFFNSILTCLKPMNWEVREFFIEQEQYFYIHDFF